MRYGLDEIFEQAQQDPYAISLDGNGYKARMVYGVKIVRDDETGEIAIENTLATGDYYTLIKPEEMEIFLDKGWRYGVYVLSLSNYRTKLDRIEDLIREEVNGKNSQKTVDNYRQQRERILNKYSEIKRKLNSLT